jgi:hypothetical protein
MTTNSLPSFRFEIFLPVIEAKTRRETNPERDTKELLWCKVGDTMGGEEYSHHRAGGCGGADCGGCASATVRRSTTATEITVQAQNPMRSQRQEVCASGKITPVFRR